MNARFFCSVGNCGRAFTCENDLKVHLDRRHGITEEKEAEVDPHQEIKQRLFGKKKEKLEAKTQEFNNLMILDACGDEGMEEVTEVKDK